MNLLVLCLSALAIVASAAGQGGPSPQLRNTPRTRAAKPADPTVNQKRNHNVIFDFTSHGGAAAYLAAMDPAKLQQLLSKSSRNIGKGRLAKMLDDDPTFVSCQDVPR